MRSEQTSFGTAIVYRRYHRHTKDTMSDTSGDTVNSHHLPFPNPRTSKLVIVAFDGEEFHTSKFVMAIVALTVLVLRREVPSPAFYLHLSPIEEDPRSGRCSSASCTAPSSSLQSTFDGRNLVISPTTVT